VGARRRFAAGLALCAGLASPGIASAVGADQTEFYAWSPGNGPIKVVFYGDPQPWSEGAHLFGSRDDKRFAWCWAPVRGEVPLSFKCASKRGQPAEFVWRYQRPLDGTPSFDDNSPIAAEYRRIARAAKIGNGKHRGDGTWIATFVCRQGCGPGVPRYVYEVAHYD
jgi:hypothetical protein